MPLPARALFCALLLAAPAQAVKALGPDAPPLAASRARAALQFYERGNYEGAAREYQAALKLHPQSATLAYNAARSLELGGRSAEAARLYRRYLALAPQAEDRAEVEALVAAPEGLAPNTSKGLILSSDPTGAQVWLDGDPAGTTPLEVELSAGEYQLEVQAEGHHPARRPVHVEADAALELHLTLTPQSTRAADAIDWRPAGWAALGLGALSLGAGALALSSASAAVDDAGGLQAADRPRYEQLEADFDASYQIGWMTLGAGAALVTGGLLVLLLSEGEVALAPTGVAGRF